MRPIGFSTGALAYADFRKALTLLRRANIAVVELSALRDAELEPLIQSLDTLDLKPYQYISLHAPSSFPQGRESAIIDGLAPVVEKGWPIILHPDAIHNHAAWRSLGSGICIENMDNRKPIGRSAKELNKVFDLLPDAQFCFDIGHARQFDTTMTEAYLLLTAFGTRLRQVHVSEVNTQSKHDVLSYTSIMGFREVAHLIPVDTPLILETPTRPGDLMKEMERAAEALPTMAVV